MFILADNYINTINLNAYATCAYWVSPRSRPIPVYPANALQTDSTVYILAVLFHGKKHPKDMGAAEMERFLTHLAVHTRVSASSQYQALCAFVFLYKHVLGTEINEKIDAERAKRPKRLPVVFSKAEVDRLMSHLDGVYWTMAGLLYGAGLRIMECARLRVKDVDFEQHHIVVRAGKGNKDLIDRSGRVRYGTRRCRRPGPGTIAGPGRPSWPDSRRLPSADLNAPPPPRCLPTRGMIPHLGFSN